MSMYIHLNANLFQVVARMRCSYLAVYLLAKNTALLVLNTSS